MLYRVTSSKQIRRLVTSSQLHHYMWGSRRVYLKNNTARPFGCIQGYCCCQCWSLTSQWVSTDLSVLPYFHLMSYLTAQYDLNMHCLSESQQSKARLPQTSFLMLYMAIKLITAHHVLKSFSQVCVNPIIFIKHNHIKPWPRAWLLQRCVFFMI